MVGGQVRLGGMNVVYACGTGESHWPNQAEGSTDIHLDVDNAGTRKAAGSAPCNADGQLLAEYCHRQDRGRKSIVGRDPSKSQMSVVVRRRWEWEMHQRAQRHLKIGNSFGKFNLIE